MRKLAALVIIASLTSLQAQEILKVGAFSAGSLTGWKTKRFAGETHYRLLPLNGQVVLEAKSIASAFGPYREIAIDLGRTPYLNWC